jgi:hypothetical protein
MGDMWSVRWLVGLAPLFCTVAEGRAQVIVVPSPVGVSGFIGGRSGLIITQNGPRTQFALRFQRSYGYGYFAPNPYSSFYGSRVFVFYSPPPPPAAIVIGQPPEDVPDDRGGILLVPRRRRPPPELGPEAGAPPRPEPPPMVEAPLPGAPASVFRPIGPADRARAQEPVPPDRPRLPEPEPLPPDREPGLPRPLPPEAEPKKESTRQVALGKEAFAAQEYARAVTRFRQASKLFAQDPMAHFLLAQALFAIGKYDEAVEAIHAGMRLQPDWPKARFRPAELYGPNAADFPGHLKRLQAAVERHPDDSVLLFLYAYELWFDGRQEESLPLFRRAAAVAPDKTYIERFLQAQPEGAVAAR